MSSYSESENSNFMWSDIEMSPKDDMDQQIKREMLESSKDQISPVLMKKNKKSKKRNIKKESSDGDQQESELTTIKMEVSTDTEIKRHKKKKSKDKKKEKHDLNVDNTDYLENESDISKIKTEILSDAESRKKKKKSKQKISEELNSTVEEEEIDESYLNLRVKQEQEEHRMNSNQQNSDTSYLKNNFDIESKGKRKRKNTENYRNNEDSEASNNIVKNKHGEKYEDYMSIDDKITVEETRVQSPVRHRNNSQRDSLTRVDEAQSDNEEEHQTNMSQAFVPPQVNGGGSGNIQDSSSSKRKVQISQSHYSDTDLDATVSHDRGSMSKNSTIDSRRKSISERLTFEEDAVQEDSSNMQQENSKDSHLSLPMKHFLSKKTSLKLVHAHSASNITSDDEVWAVSAPRTLQPEALLGAELDVGPRGKLRAAGRSYVSEGREGRVVLAQGGALAAARGGSVVLWCRLGRTQTAPPESAPTPPTAIPLPPTRLRHPLLGADYKRALKLPSAVRTRLLAAAAESTHKRRRKDRPRSPEPEHPQELCEVKQPKPKRRHRDSGECEVDQPQPKRRHRDSGERSRGKRRRSASGEREAEQPRAKRRKPAAAAAGWDNEQAIEDNLFNF